MINGIFENTAFQRNQLQQWEKAALEKSEARMKDKERPFYGNPDNYEWRHYFLRDNETSLSQCPFHPKLNKNKE